MTHNATGHNHVTRDIKPHGQCAACDVYHASPPGCDSVQYGGVPPSVADGRCRCITCSRCGHHTGNATQGHYWSWCKVAKSMRDFHFCCVDPAFGCELERAK